MKRVVLAILIFAGMLSMSACSSIPSIFNSGGTSASSEELPYNYEVYVIRTGTHGSFRVYSYSWISEGTSIRMVLTDGSEITVTGNHIEVIQRNTES